MSNNFAEFLDEFSSSIKTEQKLNSFIERSDGQIKYNTGGTGSLGGALHQEIQRTVSALIQFRNNNCWEHDRIVEKQKATKNLTQTLKVFLANGATVDNTSILSIDGMAAEVIAEVFEPLFKKSTELFAQIGEPFEVVPYPVHKPNMKPA